MVSARSSFADVGDRTKTALFNVLFAMKRAWLLKITNMLCFILNLMFILGLKPKIALVGGGGGGEADWLSEWS